MTVLKQSGAIRICVDLKPLNESVLREVHPIPWVDDVLAQIAGANVISKLVPTVASGRYHWPRCLDCSPHLNSLWKILLNKQDAR